MTDGVTRRAAVRGVAVAGVSVPLLAACGADDETGGTAQPTADATGGSDGASTGGTTDGLASTTDIPVGGGKVFEREQVVVVQPADGDFKAYSAVCPHQQCVFTEVVDNTIKCGGCHQAEFAAADGKNTAGPNGGDAALADLQVVQIAVNGDSITLT
ncbi:MAG: Rieske (2Fe-2S) protein [Nocardioides sp.]